MYRFLLSRRWIGALLGTLLLCAAFGVLGLWQLGRFETEGAVFVPDQAVATAPATPGTTDGGTGATGAGPSGAAPAPSVTPTAQPTLQPTLERAPPNRLQNLSYAFQWWVFALGAVVFVGRAIRVEARERAAREAGPDVPVAPVPVAAPARARRRRGDDDDERDAVELDDDLRTRG